MNWAENANELDELWKQRHDAAQLSELVQKLDAAQGYELLWRASRLLHFRAMQAIDIGDKKAAHELFTEGAETGHAATGLQNAEVEGNFWQGVCLLEAARLHGNFAALKTLPEAQKHIERAMNIDETFHFAGPLRVWGRITHFKPLLLGGSVDRALDIYRRALQIAPHNSTTLLYLAEAYLADHQPRQARQILQQIIAAPDDPDWIWEQARDRKIARTLLEQ